MDLIKDFIRSHGYDFEPEHLDDTWHEFKSATKKGAYIGSRVGDKIVLTFKDWRTGEKFHTKQGFSDTPKDQKEYAKHLKKISEEKIAKQLDVAVMAREDFNLYQDYAEDRCPGYCNLKAIGKILGTKRDTNSWGTTDLIVPLRDVATGEIWNLQRIQPDGFKTFLPGGRVEGLCFWVGEFGSEVYLCEGIATGASVARALTTTAAVVTTFGSQNLVAVARRIRQTYPSIQILICADNDHTNPENPGLTKAIEALELVGGRYCYPIGVSGTDFNDMQKELGAISFGELIEVPLNSEKLLNADMPKKRAVKPRPKKVANDEDQMEMTPQEEAVHEELQVEDTTPETPQASIVKTQVAPFAQVRIAPEESVKLTYNGVLPLLKEDAKEIDYALHVIKSYGTLLERFNGELYRYVGTHWEELGPDDEADLFKKIQAAFDLTKNCTQSKQRSILHTLKTWVPRMKTENILNPPSKKTAFSNGTLELTGEYNNWKLTFREHRPSDYLLCSIPWEFDVTRTKRNLKFEKALDEILTGDPEKEQKLLLIQEMYGACLMPNFPRIFMLWGGTNKGKSSIIKGAKMLVHERNLGELGPNEMIGFDVESLIGKLVNIKLEIDIKAPLNDAILKSFEDNSTSSVKRKFKVHAKVKLPVVHIFGANKIPATYERGIGAHNRRWTVIRIDHFTPPKNANREFFEHIFAENPSGVVNWALEGLERLISNNGHYSALESSRETMEELSLQKDAPGQFFKEIREDESEYIKIQEGERLNRTVFWKLFCKWNDVNFKKNLINSAEFFERALGAGFMQRKIGGERFFLDMACKKPDLLTRLDF